MAKTERIQNMTKGSPGASGLCRVAILKTLSNMLVTVIVDH